MRLELEALLIRHEAMRLKPYQCSEGKLTIGVGRNLEDVGLSEEEAMVLLRNDIRRCELEAAKFPWFKGLTAARQDVILSMLFNLGFKRFLGFRAMISALQKGDFDRASTEMLDSKWAKQVKGRAVELSEMMRVG